MNLQGDVIKFGDDMDKASTDLRPAINKLLEANGMSSMEDVINNAKKQLNDEEKRQFEAVSLPATSETYNIVDTGLI